MLRYEPANPYPATTAAYLNRAADLPARRTVAVISGGAIKPDLLSRLLC